MLPQQGTGSTGGGSGFFPSFLVITGVAFAYYFLVIAKKNPRASGGSVGSKEYSSEELREISKKHNDLSKKLAKMEGKHSSDVVTVKVDTKGYFSEYEGKAFKEGKIPVSEVLKWTKSLERELEAA